RRAMSRVRRTITSHLGVILGGALVALALSWFLVPNRIPDGGVSGLATITHYPFAWPAGVAMLAVVLPLFLASINMMRTRFGVKTVSGTVATSVLVDLTAPSITPLTQDAALAAIYGGALAGAGIGITFRFGGSTGGTDMAARLLNHFTAISVGR